jgi:hypothetical protein
VLLCHPSQSTFAHIASQIVIAPQKITENDLILIAFGAKLRITLHDAVAGLLVESRVPSATKGL